jgi:hypothetical protein
MSTAFSWGRRLADYSLPADGGCPGIGRSTARQIALAFIGGRRRRRSFGRIGEIVQIETVRDLRRAWLQFAHVEPPRR